MNEVTDEELVKILRQHIEYKDGMRRAVDIILEDEYDMPKDIGKQYKVRQRLNI